MKPRPVHLVATFALGFAAICCWERIRIGKERAAVEALRERVASVRTQTSLIFARHPKFEGWNESGRTTAWEASILDGVSALKAAIEALPDQRIPELAFLSDSDWIVASARLPAEPTAEDLRMCIARLQQAAKQAFADTGTRALKAYLEASGGELPKSWDELAPYLGAAYSPALSDRYQLTHQGPVDLVSASAGEKLVAELPEATGEFDQNLFTFGRAGSSSSDDPNSRNWPSAFSIPPSVAPEAKTALAAGIQAYMQSHAGAIPQSNDELKPYVHSPADPHAAHDLEKMFSGGG